MTAAERTTLASISFPAKVIPLTGTSSSADNANIRAAIAAIKASGQPGEILMSGDFMIGHAGDLTGIDPDSCPYLKLTGRGYCRWYKGVAATTTGLTGGDDPGDGTAYRLLARDIDDGPGKTLIISNIIFEGDLETTMKQLGDASRLIALDHYDRVELIDVEGRWGSQMGFTFGYCNQVRANRIHLNRIARDGFNASNCADVAVTDCDFEWIIDDCCAANLSAGRRRRPRPAARLPLHRQPRLQRPGRQGARRQARHSSSATASARRSTTRCSSAATTATARGRGRSRTCWSTATPSPTW